MNKFFAFCVLVLGLLTPRLSLAQPMTGTFSVDGTVATGGTNFKTLAEAITALNTNGVSGPVVINIAAGQTFTEVLPVLKATGTSTNTIRFQKGGVGTKPIIRRNDAGSITTTTRGGAGDAIFVIQGSDFITIDSLDFRGETAAIEYGILVKKDTNDGCRNLVIRANSIRLRGDSSFYTAAIYLSNLWKDTVPNSADGAVHTKIEGKHNGVLITNNTITSGVDGILQIGAGVNSYFDEGIVIGMPGQGNTIQNIGGVPADLGHGIFLQNHTLSFVQNNTITCTTTAVASANAIVGIHIGNLVGTAPEIKLNTIGNLTALGSVTGINIQTIGSVNISRNKIYGLTTKSKETTATVRGIAIQSGSLVKMVNNMIGAFRADSLNNPNGMSGIHSILQTIGTTLQVYANTIYLDATTKASNFGSEAIYAIGSTAGNAGSLDLRNNLLINVSQRSGLGMSVSLRRSASSLNNYSATSNYNIYYAGTPGPANLIYFDGSSVDEIFSAFRLRVGQKSNTSRDLFSQTELPPFQSVNGTDVNFLHLNSTIPTFAESGGGSTGVTDDFDGQQRAGTPDVGADEFNGTTKNKGMIITDFTNVTGTATQISDTIASRLARKILGKGVTLVECRTGLPTQRDYPRYQGSPVAAGYFANGTGAVDMEEGIVLTSGRAKTQSGSAGVDGPSSMSPSTNNNQPGDPLWLDNYLRELPNTSMSDETHDASILRFSFIPDGDVMEFNYVFTSHEYQSFTCTGFTDVFAFLMIAGDGVPGSPMDKNIAKVPGTNLPVAINTINRGPGTPNAYCPAGQFFPQYYIDNSPGVPPTSLYLTHKGKTVVLKAVYKGLKPCTKYTILIGIADVNDGVLDSGVFIEANSFKSNAYNVVPTNGFYMSDTSVTAVEGCKPAEMKVRLQSPSTQQVTLKFSIEGTATKDVDYTLPGGAPVPDSLVFAPGEIEKSLILVPVADNITEGIEKIVIRPKSYECRAAIAALSCKPPPPLPDSFIVYIQDTIRFRNKFKDTICVPPVTLTATQVPGFPTQTYVWNTNPVQNTPSIDVSDSGLYVVQHFYSYSNTNEGCINIDSFDVFDGRRQAKFTLSDTAICLGDTIWVRPDTSVNSTNWYWNFGNGVLDTTQTKDSFFIVYTEPGVYVITDSIVSDAGCPTKVATDTVVVYGKPILGFTLPEGCIPTDGLVNFTDTSWIPDSTRQVINKWRWEFGDANATATNPDTSIAQHPSHYYKFGSYDVYLSATTDKGCTKDTTQTVFINVKPALLFAPLDTVCVTADEVDINKGSVTNQVPGIGWYTGLGVTDTAAGKFSSIIAGPGRHTITYHFQSDSLCVDSVTQDIVVYATPVAAFSIPDSCFNTAGFVQFTNLTTIADTQVVNYAWNFGHGTPPNNTSTLQNPSHNYSDGSYLVQLTASTAFGCTDTDTSTKTIKLRAALSYAPLASRCISDSIIMVNTATVTNGVPGSGTYKGPGVTNANTGEFTSTVAGPGMHTLWYVFDNNSCKDSVSQTITIYPKPTITSFAFTPAGCLNSKGAAQFAATATAPGTTIQSYRWWFGDSTVTGSTPSNLQNPAMNMKDTTIIVTLRVVSGNGCVKDTSQNFTFKLTPALTKPVYNPVCEDVAPFTLTAPPVTNGVKGQGVFSGGAFISADGLFNPAVAGGGLKTFQYKFTTNAGCDTTIDLNINVYPRPSASFTADADVCQGKMVTITPAPIVTNISSWKWWFSDVDSTVKSINLPFTHNYPDTGLQTIKLVTISPNGCISEVKTQDVMIHPVPKASFKLAEPICFPGGTAKFNNTTTFYASNQNITWKWEFGDGSAISSAQHPEHLYTTAGTYQVKLTATSVAGGCVSSAIVPVKTNMKPTASFTINPAQVCQGKPVTFQDKSAANGTPIKSWNWTLGNEGPASGSTVSRIMNSAGDFTIKLVVTNDSGCVASTEQPLKVHVQPKIDAGPSFVVPQGTIVSFQPKANDSTSVSFSWTPKIPQLIDDNQLNAKLMVLNDGIFWLTATTNNFGCTATDSLNVKMLRAIQIPNAFSPNGDGINDTWQITGLADYPGHSVEIFNRQGVIVFSSHNYNIPWDGTYNGTPLPVATYYYIINPKNGFPAMTGYITLLR